MSWRAFNTIHDLFQAEGESFIIFEQGKEKVNMVGHYDGAMHVNSAAVIVEAMVKNAVPYRFRDDQALFGSKGDEDRSIGLLEVR